MGEGSGVRIVGPDVAASRARPGGGSRVTGSGVDGKFFAFDGERFYVRGVTYGTFAETELGLFPRRERVEEDFMAMVAAGINNVRSYNVPWAGGVGRAVGVGWSL